MVGTKIVSNIADRLKLSKKEKEKLVTLVRWHQFSVTEMQTDSAIRRFITHVGLENIEDMLILRVADRLGSGAVETSWRLEDFKKRILEVQKQPFSVKDLKIDGRDVMKELNLKPGPKVGEILAKLFNEVVEKKYLAPPIPMQLVNGATGIAAGWSSYIPNCEPFEVIQWYRVRNLMYLDSKKILKDDKKEDNKNENKLPALVTPKPWWKGFKGTVELKKMSLKKKKNVQAQENNMNGTAARASGDIAPEGSRISHNEGNNML